MAGRSGVLGAGRGGALSPVAGRFLVEQARTWAVGSDPGLLRLQTAIRTTIALGVALGVLYLLALATGAPVTVSVLGAVVAMISARAVNEPDPRRQRITLLLLPVPAAAAITVASLLGPHWIAADVVFVAITFVAVYVRRFGPRGMALGMVAVMTYFFTLFLEATPAELPWLIAAVAVGAACTLLISSYLLPDRPERVLHRTVRALRARMAIVAETAADVVAAGPDDERRRRRLAVRVARLNETALMAQSQIEEKVDPALVWPGVDGADLALRLFDAELTFERVAITAGRAAGADLAPATRSQVAAVLSDLAAEMRVPRSVGLDRVEAAARPLITADPAGTRGTELYARRVGMAVTDAVAVIRRIRELAERGSASPAAPLATQSAPEPPDGDGMRPTTRQAIQVTVAVSLAIVAGEALSPARWYWAVIAAFVTFAGTTSFGETLTKGWQRLLGTVLGVPAGVLVATAVSGRPGAAVLLIFVCLFAAFYLMKVSYALMIFWITTVLALLYGLLGQFSLDVLVLRIEETAIGAVIGVGVALLVLPTRTKTAIRDAACAFLTALSESVDTSVAALAGDTVHPTDQARRVHTQLQQFRTAAKPVTVGIAGIAGRNTMRRSLRLVNACDHYARALARASAVPTTQSRQVTNLIAAAAAQTRANIDALIAHLQRRDPRGLRSATDLLDAAEALATPTAGPDTENRRVAGAVQALRQIDRALLDAAVDLGVPTVNLW
ncbi:FUSC family protein [Mycolicibacillus koreensis]|nr:FUSC family protein [Mycolicibacillus koreensis]BBY55143.1 FUSC family protein [Mycolicibacillus koreensis]